MASFISNRWACSVAAFSSARARFSWLGDLTTGSWISCVASIVDCLSASSWTEPLSSALSSISLTSCAVVVVAVGAGSLVNSCVLACDSACSFSKAPGSKSMILDFFFLPFLPCFLLLKLAQSPSTPRDSSGRTSAPALLSGLLKSSSLSSSGTAAGNSVFSSASTSLADWDSSLKLCSDFLLFLSFFSRLTLGHSSSAALSPSTEASRRLLSSRLPICPVESAFPVGTADGNPLSSCILIVVLGSVEIILSLSETEAKGPSAVSAKIFKSVWLLEDCSEDRNSSRGNSLLRNSALSASGSNS